MLKVLDGFCVPTRGTKYSAGVDLYAREDVIINMGETKLIPLGVKIDIDYIKDVIGGDNSATDEISGAVDAFMRSHYFGLKIRSSSALKGLIIPNGEGVIDMDYPDEINLMVHYPFTPNGVSFYEIEKGDKVAQIMLLKHETDLLNITSDAKRIGGFGSTGGTK